MKRCLRLGIVVVFVSLFIYSADASIDTEEPFNDIKRFLLEKNADGKKIDDAKDIINEIIKKDIPISDLEQFLLDVLERTTKEGQDFKNKLVRLNGRIKGSKSIQALNIKHESDCVSKKGKWISRDWGSSYFCILPTDDKDKECSDVAQCQGTCIAQLTEEQKKQLLPFRLLKMKGQCSGWTFDNGCDTTGLEVHHGAVGHPLYCQ